MATTSPNTLTTINLALSLPAIPTTTISRVKQYLATNTILTKKEGNSSHVNVFFLPYDKKQNKIYLGFHKKADDWIPPGGHIEPGETPIEAVIREMQEELATNIAPTQLELWNLSYKYIGREEMGCVGHYDLWYLVHTDSTHDFVFDRGEYYDAGWFSLTKGIAKINKNQDFAVIVSQLASKV